MATLHGNGLAEQLRKCWNCEFNWDLLPGNVKEGCVGVASLLSVPPLAILVGVQGVLSFAIAHAEVQVPNTMWREPGLLWLAIGMPTGTGKSIIKKYLIDLLRNVRERLKEDKISFSDQTFEKLGEVLFMTQPATALPLIVDNSKDANSPAASHFLWVFPRPVFLDFNSLVTDGHKESWDAAREFTVLLEDILIMIFKAKASAQDQEEVTNYSIEITKKRIFPKPMMSVKQLLKTIVKLIHLCVVSIVVCVCGKHSGMCVVSIVVCVCGKHSAMSSKAKGQYLCMSLPCHALFLSRPLPDALPSLIPEDAQQAAISMVNLCIQHTQLLAAKNIHPQ
ncbi:hypothetical protein OS493_005322 [Desmophyllum pertusum]|uniref:Uncharacterized protein n=1 Tax=Desmophyllum pertusum TaxID=174260 RepID=A0A9W9YRZ7_9CNID|nr:hypothetical protein OS493_005322 [Desmophyllum pertusum]